MINMPHIFSDRALVQNLVRNHPKVQSVQSPSRDQDLDRGIGPGPGPNPEVGLVLDPVPGNPDLALGLHDRVLQGM